MLRLTLALSLLVVPAAAAADMWDRPFVTYACDDGVARSFMVRADGNYAWLSLNGSPQVELPRLNQSIWGTAHFSVRVVERGIEAKTFKGKWRSCFLDGATR